MGPALRFFLIALMLTGCAIQHAPPVAIDDPAHYQQQLAALQHWQLQGKIAVRHADQSDSAALQWQQAKEHFDIFISGPLGAGATRLSGDAQQLTIENDTLQQTSTNDPSHLVEQHLGWELPLAQLPHWVLGQGSSSDTHPNARYNADHTLAGFRSGDWQVEYLAYQVVGTWLLPQKIRLQHEDLQVTLVIKQWELR